MPTEFKAFLGTPGRMWATDLRLMPTIKRSCVKLAHMWGYRQIPVVNLVLVMQSKPADMDTGEAQHLCHVTKTLLGPQGNVHSNSHLLWVGLVYHLMHQVALFKGMPTGFKALLEKPDHSRFCPAPSSHVKKRISFMLGKPSTRAP